ncbi:PiggyBac transposable element-derived protein 2 [Trichinella zimbabwensis]|uniref:PiggyBac transposable element-derived protein 2 n=1 Tax=Trichinella zimbabwensis TaxID=268475 RepID=A0A0V1I3N6_9BILA|nr:PiggyBac transposable element-derived protein 2 [Trichinella zimbabwensis]
MAKRDKLVQQIGCTVLELASNRGKTAATPARRPLVTSVNFDGQQSLEDWIVHFEVWTELNEWSDEEKLKIDLWKAEKAFPELSGVAADRLALQKFLSSVQDKNVRMTVLYGQLEISRRSGTHNREQHEHPNDSSGDEDDASVNAKRKSYIWCRRPFKPETSALFGFAGQILPVLRPIDYFPRYFTPELLSHIILETNRKANQCLYVSLAATEAEMEVLTGMLIKMGIISMPRYRMYWSNQTRVDAVANCMSRNRFEALL